MLSKKFKGNFVLTCILFITIFIVLIGDSSASALPKTASTFSHKIFISGNDNLDAFVTGNGTTGLTLENAHIIENFTIQTGTQDYGIFIQNVDRYLIIRNCTISVVGSEFSAKSGIEIRISTNIIIENCTVSSHELGIQFLDSHCSILRDSMIIGNTEAGVRLLESDQNSLQNNTVTLNEGFGIHLKRSHENLIANNTITENTDLGIYDRGDNNIFENNTCAPSTKPEIFSKAWLWVVLGVGGAVVLIGGLMFFITLRGRF